MMLQLNSISLLNNGVITATLKDGFTKSLGDAENTQVIDTTKFAFGRYYKFDIPTTVKADVPGWCRYRKYCGSSS